MVSEFQVLLVVVACILVLVVGVGGVNHVYIEALLQQ